VAQVADNAKLPLDFCLATYRIIMRARVPPEKWIRGEDVLKHEPLGYVVN